MLTRLENIKGKLERVEHEAFYRRITSLKSNISYWSKIMDSTTESKFNRAEAQTEIDRCGMLLGKVNKDLKKKEDDCAIICMRSKLKALFESM